MSQIEFEKVCVRILPDGRMDRTNAAKYLGLSKKALEKYALNKTGPKYIKRGRAWYYKTDLDEWLEQGRVETAA